MSPEQLSPLIAELRGIKLALYVTSALVVISVVFAAVRTYFAARHHLEKSMIGRGSRNDRCAHRASADAQPAAAAVHGRGRLGA